MLEVIELEQSIGEQALKAIRILLTKMADKDPDSVAQIDGIDIFERTEDLPVKTSCFTYLFGEADFEKTQTGLIIPENQLLHPEPGAIVQYSTSLFPTHVGLVLSNGRVRSKWGLPGHVYDHRARLVPYQYGNTLEYYRATCILEHPQR